MRKTITLTGDIVTRVLKQAQAEQRKSFTEMCEVLITKGLSSCGNKVRSSRGRKRE